MNAPRRTILRDEKRGFCVRAFDRYVDKDVADALFKEIDANPNLVSDTVVVFGKTHTVKRRAAAYSTLSGNKPLSYRYSGKTMHAQPAPPSILQLARRLERDLEQPFNFVLIQAYDGGDVSLGWHADNERDIHKNSTIASVSLGATRDFQLRENEPKSPRITVPLEHGTLLTMEGTTQQHTKHCVPKRAKQQGRRINLTFRHVK